MNPADLLTLTQWLSPSYPVGAFSYSHGLETAISQGCISSSEDLQNWLKCVIEHGSGWNDLVLLNAAYRASSKDDQQDIIELSEALCSSRERLHETLSQGAAFVRTTNAVWGTGLEPYPYPVAVGFAAAHQKIDLNSTAYMLAHSFASNLISASQRLLPIGQTEGQSVLHNLSSVCADTAKFASSASLDDLGSCAFGSDIASMNHETQIVRIFQS